MTEDYNYQSEIILFAFYANVHLKNDKLLEEQEGWGKPSTHLLVSPIKMKLPSRMIDSFCLHGAATSFSSLRRSTLLLIWQDTYEYYSYKQTEGGRQGCSEGGIFLTLSILHGNGWQPPMNSLTLLISLGSLLVRIWFLTFGIRKNIWLKFQRSIPLHSTKNNGIHSLFFFFVPSPFGLEIYNLFPNTIIETNVN